MYLAGYSRAHGLIINDFDNARVLSIRPDGSHFRVLHTDAQAMQVVGCHYLNCVNIFFFIK